MSYKELKESEEPKTSNCVVYTEILSTIVVVGMFCGTIILTTNMWIQEQRAEMTFLRGFN